jgi:hypothetical protein
MDFIKTCVSEYKNEGDWIRSFGFVCTVSLYGIEDSPWYTYLIINEIGIDFPELDLICIEKMSSRNMTSLQFLIDADIPASYVRILDIEKLNSQT